MFDNVFATIDQDALTLLDSIPEQLFYTNVVIDINSLLAYKGSINDIIESCSRVKEINSFILQWKYQQLCEKFQSYRFCIFNIKTGINFQQFVKQNAIGGGELLGTTQFDNNGENCIVGLLTFREPLKEPVYSHQHNHPGSFYPGPSPYRFGYSSASVGYSQTEFENRAYAIIGRHYRLDTVKP